MKISWFGDFFRTLPDAFHSFWLFGDPSGVGDGWWGLVILMIWGVGFMAVPLVVARRTHGTHEWVSAATGAIGGLAIFWWAFGILPSAWIYFISSSQEVLAGPIIPDSMTISMGWAPWAPSPDYTLNVASNLYTVIRDLVVVLAHLAAFVLVFWAALRIQKQFPKTLAPGEVRPGAGGHQ